MECCKNHSNPLLETPCVSADDSSLTRTLWDLSACQMEPHEPGLAGGALPASPLLKDKRDGHLGTNPPLAQFSTEVCCPRGGCKAEANGARRPSPLPALAQEQKSPAAHGGAWQQFALRLALPPVGSSLSLSICGRHKMVPSLRLSWRAEGRLLLRGGKGREGWNRQFQPLPLCYP